MIVYRIAQEKYKGDISGNGAAIYGGRWNSVGQRMLYTSQYISLSILESLVHFDKHYVPINFYLLFISIPDPIELKEISNSKIKIDWQNHFDYTQWMGDQFLNNNQSVGLKVPSVVVPEECNILLNPQHVDFDKISIIKSEPLHLDNRLLILKK